MAAGSMGSAAASVIAFRSQGSTSTLASRHDLGKSLMHRVNTTPSNTDPTQNGAQISSASPLIKPDLLFLWGGRL